MNNIQFSKQFTFLTITHRSASHTDNSKGLDRHFVACMRTGKGRIVTLDKKILQVEAGDLFYLPLGLQYHSYWTPDPITGRVEWDSLGFEVFPNPRDVSYSPQRIEADEEARALLRGLADTREITAGSVGRLYLFLERVLPTMEQEEGETTLLLNTIRAFVEEYTAFSVPTLAKACGMSESGLYAYVKRQTGKTPVELKNSIRAKQAKELLRTTDLSVEEISTRLGIHTAAYLRKLVKEHTGKTPQQIRRENQRL